MPVVVMAGKGYVEARIAGVSKGMACQWVIEHAGEDIQFALAIGDDRSDEEMFQVLANLVPCRNSEYLAISPKSGLWSPASASHGARNSNSVYSVTVGKKPSAANWYLNDTEEVSDLLDALIGQRAISSLDVFDSDQDTPIDFISF